VSEQEEIIQDNIIQEADTAFRAVLAASLRTLLCFVMIFSLLCGVFFVSLPFSMMRISDFLGHEGQALMHANRAANSRHVKGYNRTRALVRGLELSSQFLDECDSFARQVIFFSEEFIGDDSFLEQNRLIDEFNFNQLRLMGLEGRDRILFIMFYCYWDFVYVQNARARAILGETDYILFNELLANVNSLEYRDIGHLDLDSRARLFNQVEIIIRYNNGVAPYILNGLIDILVDMVSSFTQAAISILINSTNMTPVRARIRTLYHLFSVHNFMTMLRIEKDFEGIDTSIREFIYSQLNYI